MSDMHACTNKLCIRFSELRLGSPPPPGDWCEQVHWPSTSAFTCSPRRTPHGMRTITAVNGWRAETTFLSAQKRPLLPASRKHMAVATRFSTRMLHGMKLRRPCGHTSLRPRHCGLFHAARIAAGIRAAPTVPS